MKLTNYIRDAFITAAMQDVPRVDYSEQARAVANKAIKDAFEKDFPGLDFEKTKQSGWLPNIGIKMPNALMNLYGPAKSWDMLEKMPKVWEKLTELSRKHGDQAQARGELERKLRAVAYSCSTRKALAEALPEFTDYLPADEAKAIRSLPVVANVVTDFVKAGWPKSVKKMPKAEAVAA